MQRSRVVKFVPILLCCLVSSVVAELPKAFIDSTDAIIDTLRKRNCVVNISSPGRVVSGKEIRVRQLRNHFGFGASIGKKWFTKTDSARYGDAFRTYFEWATPENEMKWQQNEQSDDYQDFELADSLISWCRKNDIKVRGHNLFWNERKEWMPSWALELNQANFKLAMARRIDGAMAHFKGRVAHWDIINEIVHFKDIDGKTQISEPGLLAQLSGDNEIFSWILKRARSIDSGVTMAVNEYCVIEQCADTRAYISKIKDTEAAGGKIDVVGLEGHFDDYLERPSYMERIDTIAKSLPHDLWLTEVDFTLKTSVPERADKMEELMRSAFAYPKIGGLVLWAWWEGNLWKTGLSSILVDSSYHETGIGTRWRTVRDKWKTDTSGVLTADGKFTFNGFHGKYEAAVLSGDSLFLDTFYLAPGSGETTIVLDLAAATGVMPKEPPFRGNEGFFLGGRQVPVVSADGNDEFLLSGYTLAGRLLCRQPVSRRNGKVALPSMVPPGVHVITIQSKNRTIYKGVGYGLH